MYLAVIGWSKIFKPKSFPIGVKISKIKVMLMKKATKVADVGVIVGRFQVPFLHEGHQEILGHVCNKHSKVLIFLGLSPCLVTRNNPLDFEARKQMLLQSYPKATVCYIKDSVSDDVWSKKLDEQIGDLVSPNQSVTLYGGRDSFIDHYTGKYPTELLEATRFLSGTEIRNSVSNKVKASPDFRAGVIWAAYNQYPKVFPTVDCAIFNDDMSKLLLARKPHETLYRFVGGFAQSDSPSYEADVRREVQEEAGITITDPVYVGSMKVDDWRYRREVDKITTVLYTAKHLSGRPEGGDDVAEVRWFPYRRDVADSFEASQCFNPDKAEWYENMVRQIVPEHRGLFKMLVDKNTKIVF
jgi:bifunctional NMN adenylyltransferase/nudix hydrolase